MRHLVHDSRQKTQLYLREVVSRGEHERNICIEIQYRTEITKRKRLVTYHLEIGREQGKVCVVEEFLRYKRGSSGSPYYFFRFSKGKGAAVTNEEDFSKTDEKLNRETQDLGSSEILVTKRNRNSVRSRKTLRRTEL